MKIKIIDNEIKINKTDMSFFWNNKIYFTKKNPLDFDENLAYENLIKEELTIENIKTLVNNFLDLYESLNYSSENLIFFNKTANFIKKLTDISIDTLYQYSLEKINCYKKKESFNIYYYFCDINDKQLKNKMYESEQNIYFEILNWLSVNNDKIDELRQMKTKSMDIFALKGWQSIQKIGFNTISGISGKGKSSYLLEQLLNKKHNKEIIIISNKECNLENFVDDDKKFFVDLFINLTKDEDLNKLNLIIEKIKGSIELKGVAKYIEKHILMLNIDKNLITTSPVKIKNNKI